MRHDVDAETASLLARCLNREPKHRPSAADNVRALSSDPSGPSSARRAIGSGGVEETADFQQLMKRRVPQVVLITGGAGLALTSLMNELTADQELLPESCIISRCLSSRVALLPRPSSPGSMVRQENKKRTFLSGSYSV